MPAGHGLWPGSRPLGPRIRRLMRMCDGPSPTHHPPWVTSLGRTRCRVLLAVTALLPHLQEPLCGARAVGLWVGEQKPLGKTPLRGIPSPESTYLPTSVGTLSPLFLSGLRLRTSRRSRVLLPTRGLRLPLWRCHWTRSCSCPCLACGQSLLVHLGLRHTGLCHCPWTCPCHCPCRHCPCHCPCHWPSRS